MITAAQDTAQLLVLMNTAINIGVPQKPGKFFG
jgi:hypothetical protein